MRVGIDVDGVLANFFSAYEDAVATKAGRDLFPARYPEALPPVWDWPQHFGYTDAEMSAVWKDIKASDNFWQKLTPLAGANQLRGAAPWKAGHDVYFITNRPGATAKAQTEQWLRRFLSISIPTVLVCGDKGPLVNSLGLDCFLDDKPENVQDVDDAAPLCRTYLLSYPYNTWSVAGKRVGSVAEFLTAEGL